MADFKPTTQPGTKARAREIQAWMAAEGKLVIGFCRCPRPASQTDHKSLLRQNMLTGPADLDNPKCRCLSCGSTYSAAGV